MNELYFMVTITDRNMAKLYLALYAQHGVDVTLRAVGHGTAASETLDAFGLERAEKAVIFSVVTGETWRTVKKALKTQLHPGHRRGVPDPAQQHRRQAPAAIPDRTPKLRTWGGTHLEGYEL